MGFLDFLDSLNTCKDCVCEALWVKKPLALLGTNLWTLDICESNNINAFTRALILTIVVGVILMYTLQTTAGFALPVLLLVVIYYKWLSAKIFVDAQTAVREAFTGVEIRPDMKTENAFPEPYVPYFTSPGVAVPQVTPPKARNPFMNVLLDEITYNPTRPPADDVSSTKNKVSLDDMFHIQWFNDPTDVYGKTQGQRQFYTMPSTSVPNDQGSYQNWLYLIPGKTCKEGGRDACVPGTNGGAIPWLSQPN